MGSPLELCLVIPTLNESGNIGPLLARLDKALIGIGWEVVFVDDDSRDGTADVVRALHGERPEVRVLQRIGRRGLSSGCMEGIMATAAPYVAVMDADMQHDEQILPEMLRRVRDEHYDVAIGSRNLETGGMGEFSRERVMLSEGGRRLSQMVCKIPVTDPMSGFFLVERGFAHRAIRRMSGYSYKVLLDMISASPVAPRWVEVGYVFRARVNGESKLDLNTLLEFGVLLIHKAVRGAVPVRFVLFCLVGATGVAMASIFWLNNQFTFRERRLRGWNLLWGGIAFLGACTVGAVTSVLVALGLLEQGTPWYWAGGIGTVVGAVWNFGVTSVLTWPERRQLLFFFAFFFRFLFCLGRGGFGLAGLQG